MTERQSSYKQIFKASSLFGGVQIISILISIVRAKFVAVLLGTAGVGIMSLLQSTLTLITILTSLGIDISAVRDISEANGTGDEKRISRVITIFRRWIWVTSLLGATITLILSPLLSRWTFGNSDYTFSFMWLSSSLLFGVLSSGQIGLLHGLQKLKPMAKASILGSVIGLLISIPLYYWFGINGIVPTMILTSLTTLVISWKYSSEVKIKKINLSVKTTFHEGLNMASLGIMMTLSSFISLLVAYLINIFINRTGSTGDVGLYQAGWNITDKYVGLVFTAMITDYFPRLSKVNNDIVKVRQVVNQQAEIAILILSPILILLLSTAPIIINILYTEEFLPVVIYIEWVVLGMMFRALSWCLGFIFLAKGHSVVYFFKELISSIIVLTSSILGYYWDGLEGLGISFAISNLLIFCFVYGLSQNRYSFYFNSRFAKIFTFHFLFCVLAFFITYKFGFPWGYLSGSILLFIVGRHTWKTLDEQMHFSALILKRLGNLKSNK